MIVFNNYFKIVKKHLGLIILYASIAIVVSIMNTGFTNSEENYIDENPNVAIINYDSSVLTESFINYIDSNANIIEIKDSEREIQDALYYAKVSAVLIIPENFTNEFLGGKDIKIDIKKSLKSYSTYVELLVNRYFKTADIYNRAGISLDVIVTNIEKDLVSKTEVQILNSDDGDTIFKIAVFYIFENYSFLSIIIFVIGTIMCVFNNINIKRRNMISKLDLKKINNQIFLGHIVLTLSIWIIFTIISIILYGRVMFTTNGLLMILNSFVFIITVSSMAYLIGTFIRNKNILTGIINVVSIGLSFISGCFVSAELLDKNILNFSKIFPSYWYIQNNVYIAEISKFDSETLKPIVLNYIIVLIMSILYFGISKIIEMKKTSE